MLNHRSTKKGMPCLMLLLTLLYAQAAWSGDTARTTVKVAILPFNMHTPAGLAYLQEGIREMFASRLGWQGKVLVVEKTATEQATKGIRGDVSADNAMKIGKTLNVDYVIYGSVTGLGQSVSIDANIARVSGGGEPVSFAAQAKNLDDVIPRIDQCAQDINAKVFGRPAELGKAAAVAGSEAEATRNPELLIPDAMIQSDKSAYLNPNFIELSPEGSLRQPGIWKSQTIIGAVLAMDVGDVDGDGRPEIVVMAKDKITVFRKEGQGLKTIATYSGTKVDNYIWLSVANADQDGPAKIFLNNLRKHNTSRASMDTMYGDKGYTEGLVSVVLALSNGKLEEIAKADNYYLNAIEFPKKGRILVGQQKGEETVGAFAGGVYEMAIRGETVVPTVAVPLPDRCNVFNCIRADLKGDHVEETIQVDKSNRLLVLSPSGETIWQSDKIFAATTNSFEGRLNDRRYNDIDYYAVPSPVMVTDLNKDGIPEIIVNRNPNATAKFLPESLKSYDKGEIVSFSWDQLGMAENWKTRELNGMVTSIRLADLDNKGKDQLVVSMVAAKDLLKLADAKSTIITYELREHGKKAPDKRE